MTNSHGHPSIHGGNSGYVLRPGFGPFVGRLETKFSRRESWRKKKKIAPATWRFFWSNFCLSFKDPPKEATILKEKYPQILHVWYINIDIYTHNYTNYITKSNKCIGTYYIYHTYWVSPNTGSLEECFETDSFGGKGDVPETVEKLRGSPQCHPPPSKNKALLKDVLLVLSNCGWFHPYISRLIISPWKVGYKSTNLLTIVTITSMGPPQYASLW